MATEVTMPQLSDTMSEGKILTWLKSEGEHVSRGDAIAEVGTDKADLEVQSFYEGTLLKILTPAGTVATVGTPIAVIGGSDEVVDNSKSRAAPQHALSQEPTVSTQSISSQVADQSSQENGNQSERIKISPLARNLAKSYGINYGDIPGSGEGGRIVKKDIEKLVSVPTSTASSPTRQSLSDMPESAKAPLIPIIPSLPPQPSETTPLTQATAIAETASLSKMRQTIAARMLESKTTIPHFYVTTKICMDAAKKLRLSLKEEPQFEGITFNHLILKAAALALKKYPEINSTYKEGNVIRPQDINIGIVTAVTGGLLIPVLKQADRLSLADIVSEAVGLVKRAKSGKPRSDDLTGGSFSISNIGMYEVESFNAIINPGQGAILAISSILDEPLVVDGKFSVGSVMRVCLSVDHRIIDGVVAGQFNAELKRLLENPVLLVI